MICKWILAEWRALWDLEPGVLYKRPMSTTQVAKELHMTDLTIRRWAKEGRFPARRIGRNYQIPRGVLQALDKCKGCSGECVDGEETA